MDPYKTKYIALFLWSMYSFNVPFSPKYTILQNLETRKYLSSFLDITLTNVVLLNLAWRPALSSSYQHTTNLSRSVWECLGLFDIGHLRFENLERLTVNCRHYKHLHAVKVGISFHFHPLCLIPQFPRGYLLQKVSFFPISAPGPDITCFCFKSPVFKVTWLPCCLFVC